MTTSIRAEIRFSLSTSISAEIADVFLSELDEIHSRFVAADYRPTELSGGRFAEVCFRICEKACFGAYTAMGQQLPRTDQLVSRLAQTPAAQCDETLRIHLPRSMKLLYDLRNKRDVAHLGTSVIPNVPDSTLVLTLANWAASEVIRVFHQCSIDAAQHMADAIVERQTPLVYDKDGIVRVLDPDLNHSQRTLLVLYHRYPDSVGEKELFEIVEHSHSTRYRTGVLQTLHQAAQINFRGGQALILPPGIALAETIISSSRKI